MLDETPAGRTAEGTPPRRWLTLTSLCLADFMLVLDVTAANVALPTIGAELALGRAALTWVVTAYVVAFGGLMLLGGRLGDTVGRRRTVLAGLGVFTLGSLACGLATGAAVLIGARVVQGVGAALLAPAALSAITTTSTGAERTRALGVWSAISAVGFVAGLLVGGLLTAGPGWRWIFLVNVPIGAVLLATLPVLLAPDPPRDRTTRLDIGGALLVTAAVGALVLALTTAGDVGWLAPGTLLSAIAAIALGSAFVAFSRRRPSPLLRVELLAQRPVAAGTLVMLAASFLMLSMFFLSSLYLQQVLDHGPLATGLAFLPAAIAVMGSAHGAGHLADRFGRRRVAVAAFVLAGAGAALLVQPPAGPDPWMWLVPGMVLVGLGLGPAILVANSTTLSHVDEQESGLAAGIVNTGHELGGAIGVAVMSTAAAGGFGTAYTLMSGIAAAGVVIAAWLVPRGRSAAADGGHGR